MLELDIIKDNDNVSQGVKFLPMLNVRPAKAQTSLRICTVRSEPLLVT